MRNAFFRAFSAPRGIVHGPILALAVSAGGCSADVTRFDYPAFGITDGGSGRPTGALPTPPEPVWQRPAYAPSYAPSYTQGYNGGLSSPRGAGLGDAPPAYGEGVHGYQAQG